MNEANNKIKIMNESTYCISLMFIVYLEHRQFRNNILGFLRHQEKEKSLYDATIAKLLLQDSKFALMLSNFVDLHACLAAFACTVNKQTNILGLDMLATSHCDVKTHVVSNHQCEKNTVKQRRLI